MKEISPSALFLAATAISREPLRVIIANESWDWNRSSTCETENSFALGPDVGEFRYDSGRQRYLSRPLDVTSNGLMHNPALFVSTGDTWTSYEGDDAYRDYTLSGSTVTNSTNYEPGLWTREGTSNHYLHNDMLGTLRQTTGGGGTSENMPRVFTAFGEPINTPSPADRFGFVGSEGYQADTSSTNAFPFLHLGARYYDPVSGRFLQRDPIGIGGGLNVYLYVEGVPTDYDDPDGLQRIPVKGIDVPPSSRARLKWPPRVSRPVPPPPPGAPIVPWYVPSFPFGWPQAAACVGAAAVGAGVGLAVNYGVPAAVGTEKRRLTDYVIDPIFRWWNNGQCPGC